MGLVSEESFTIQTVGGIVRSIFKDAGKIVQVEMGKVSFWSDEIPVAGDRRERLVDIHPNQRRKRKTAL